MAKWKVGLIKAVVAVVYLGIVGTAVYVLVKKPAKQLKPQETRIASLETSPVQSSPKENRSDSKAEDKGKQEKLVFKNGLQEVPSDYDDGPGPGYNAGESGDLTANIPPGLTFDWPKERNARHDQPEASFSVSNNSGGVIPGGTRVRIILGQHLEPAVFHSMGLGPVYDSRKYASNEEFLSQMMRILNGEGLEVCRLLPGEGTSLLFFIKVADNTPQNLTSPLNVTYYAKGPTGNTWDQVGVAAIWY